MKHWFSHFLDAAWHQREVWWISTKTKAHPLRQPPCRYQTSLEF